MPYGQVNADVIQSSVSGVSLGAGNASIMKNRIINGAMVINQRGYTTGSPVNPSSGIFTYTVDRFGAYQTNTSKFTAGQSTSAPTGFTNSLNVTSSSAYSVPAGELYMAYQSIEGYNIADLGWGTANAKTVTLSFWVQSSLTGTFGGALLNSAANRSYPFTYTISSANTWTQISITIAGDTSGTWLTNNGVGITVSWGLGMGSTYSGTAGAWAGAQYWSATGATSVVGTNGATFYITGVQLEVGTSATGYEYRQYGQELALCQRYYEKSYDISTVPGTSSTVGTSLFNYLQTNGSSITGGGFAAQYKVTKRATPTVTIYSPVTGASNKVSNGNDGTDATANIQSNGVFSVGVYVTFTAQAACNLNYHFVSSAEL